MINLSNYYIGTKFHSPHSLQTFMLCYCEESSTCSIVSLDTGELLYLQNWAKDYNNNSLEIDTSLLVSYGEG